MYESRDAGNLSNQVRFGGSRFGSAILTRVESRVLEGYMSILRS